MIQFASDTTRTKGDGEIDGQDYNFVSRSQFEEYVGNKRFVEHGEFDRQYYGTSLDAVRTVINSGKICVLNLQVVQLFCRVTSRVPCSHYVFALATNFIRQSRPPHMLSEFIKSLRTLEQPASLPILHDSDLKPYVVFLSPPTLQVYRQQRQKNGEAIKVGRNHNHRFENHH